MLHLIDFFYACLIFFVVKGVIEFILDIIATVSLYFAVDGYKIPIPWGWISLFIGIWIGTVLFWSHARV